MANLPKTNFTKTVVKNKQNVKNCKVANVQKAIIATLRNYNKPLTRRRINELTSIEICTLCNPLLKLERSNLVFRVFIGLCPATGKKVTYYGLKCWEGKRWD